MLKKNDVLGIGRPEKGVYPYTSSAVSINRIEKNEIFFDITLSWAQSDFDFLKSKEIEDQFSMIYEDGMWKLGHINVCY